ncbi:MAG TPA: hypothetical protein VJX67_08760 [Blastocatellia bacterium]|nr:hypothetical protein [Blastocatellia bacterium]
MTPIVVSISGFSSEAGKTTLLCDLLAERRNWEAIKVTRGHYRSCGKDPNACCVSHLLGSEPLVLSGHDLTFKAGKDTGRYWESGAANVHWVIGADDQIESGIKTALSRVRGQGVFVEGTSFLKYIEADYSVMVARLPVGGIKSSAVAVMGRMDCIFVSDTGSTPPGAAEDIWSGLAKRGCRAERIPIYFKPDQGLIDLRISSLPEL